MDICIYIKKAVIWNLFLLLVGFIMEEVQKYSESSGRKVIKGMENRLRASGVIQKPGRCFKHLVHDSARNPGLLSSFCSWALKAEVLKWSQREANQKEMQQVRRVRAAKERHRGKTCDVGAVGILQPRRVHLTTSRKALPGQGLMESGLPVPVDV